MSFDEIILHIITGLVSALAAGGGVAWFMIRAQRRKVNTEADVNISTAWEKFTNEMQEQLKGERELRLTLQGRVDEMSKQLAELHITIARQGAELLRVREENIGLKKELTAVQEENANLKTAIDSVTADNSRLGRELVEERRKRQTLETRLNRLIRDGQPPDPAAERQELPSG
jgi:chromosome segregation ATPase